VQARGIDEAKAAQIDRHVAVPAPDDLVDVGAELNGGEDVELAAEDQPQLRIVALLGDRQLPQWICTRIRDTGPPGAFA
jgi:hypothetical protein